MREKKHYAEINKMKQKMYKMKSIVTQLKETKYFQGKQL